MGNNQPFLLGEKVKQFLLRSIPGATLASGGTVINCRCMECGDSTKSSKSAHLYIGLPTATDTGWFYCHKCNCSGILNHRKLLDWGIYDPEIASDLFNHNALIGNSGRNRGKQKKLKTGKLFNVINTPDPEDELTQLKMIYINNRLGTKLTMTDFINLKVVFNLYEFLGNNNVEKYTRNQTVVFDLGRAFVGFLSMDNGFVTLRKLDNQMVYNEINKRYINYKIFDKKDTSERFYVVPQVVNLLQPGRIKLHVAEGVFDILSIYLNVRKGEPGIYATSSGSNYSSIISYFMIEKMIPNLEVHLYPDNDQPEWKIQNLVQTYYPFMIPIYIHRNISPEEKDFGVSLDRINETIVKATPWD